MLLINNTKLLSQKFKVKLKVSILLGYQQKITEQQSTHMRSSIGIEAVSCSSLELDIRVRDLN